MARYHRYLRPAYCYFNSAALHACTVRVMSPTLSRTGSFVRVMIDVNLQASAHGWYRAPPLHHTITVTANHHRHDFQLRTAYIAYSSIPHYSWSAPPKGLHPGSTAPGWRYQPAPERWPQKWCDSKISCCRGCRDMVVGRVFNIDSFGFIKSTSLVLCDRTSILYVRETWLLCGYMRCLS